MSSLWGQRADQPVADVRIGIFHTTLPEPERKPGGVEVFVHRLANQLARSGHSVVVFAYTGSPPDAEYEPVRLEPHRWARSRTARLTAVPAALNRLDRHYGLDVLHLHGDDWFFIRRALPTVRTFYGSAFWEAVHARRLKQRLAFAAAAPLEILSSRLATSCYAAIPHHARLFRPAGTLPIGFDIPEAVPKVGERSESPSILFVGTWGGRKRGRVLHQAFLREVRPRVPTAELWMVSDHCEPGPGIDWVRRPSDRELAELYDRAWVFCSPSAYEGFGIPYLEALAHGLPVVARANPGARHVLGGCGVFSSDARLGETVTMMLSDRARREQLADQGRTRAAGFSWDAVVGAHERAYAKALAEFRR